MLLEKATSEQNESEKWDLILDVCDKAGKSSEEAKNYLKAILKRLNHSDPHVAVQAATVCNSVESQLFFVATFNAKVDYFGG